MVALRGIRFAETPPIGVAVEINGQRYDLVALEPYERKDGTHTHLSLWMGECADCCKPFMTRSALLALPESRRCGDHKRPGKTADEKAGK